MGSDRRRVRHPAPAGRPDAAGLDRRVVVAGGGIAGLTAATALAERGVHVELAEREPFLGGRAGGWLTTLPDGTRTGMSRGFHAFFRQYYNLRALLRRGDPGLARFTALPDYPLVDAHGRTDTFRGLPATPPWNALAFALRSPTFGLRDLARLDAKAALPLLTVRVPGTYHELDELDAATLLDRVRFPEAARHLAFDVFSRSFFAPPERLSAGELAVMFHLYFLGSAEGLLFDVPAQPFHRLWDPLARHLERTGARLSPCTPVRQVEPGGPRRFRVHLDGEHGRVADADAVVLALDVAGLRDVVAASPRLGGPAWRSGIAALFTAPPFVVRRLWLDRPVAAARPAFLATGGLPPLDNVSVLDRYDTDARAWARRAGGSVVELHAYAVTGGREDTERALLARLHAVYPETRDAAIVADRVEWRADCPLFPPGGFGRRPRIGTGVPGLVLAGDGIRVDLPVALMERAATTGWVAANRLLAGWGVAGHDLTTVPTSGRFAPLRVLAGRAS
ncbi:FAD-dependent oxidoreductase [Prauserella muralis]|uniref:Isorenieratene synthase n=1 Tax=Prauserella muralis TaxID=588067 RepID=A0A2V4AGV0_9PSEU|nr:FAD-dependent oxidoreductase [Prauserella muralis]PXY19152.1 isorenieratene synthase [Prauserella muralis]TWE29064.1 isorenieratene synthase [Prauserella muralis]